MTVSGYCRVHHLPARRKAPSRRRARRHTQPACGVRGTAGSSGSRTAGVLRHLRPSRLVAARRLQRGAHPGHHPGHLRAPGSSGHQRADVRRHRHARAVAACAAQRGRGARRARRRRPPDRRRLPHPDSRRVARDLAPQQRRQCRCNRRRHRHHAVAQPTAGRRLQVRPTERRSGGLRDHQSHPGPRQRVARGRLARRRTHPVRAGAGQDHRPRLRHAVRRRPRRRPRSATRLRLREFGSASIRSAARASITGRPSPSATASISP